mmetsp:Transcript_49822/g.151641  ORF Transcript_49822/g.151641 Transcript_49822/m.151641 type:complete len:208 (-) Transcript_49822:19-642(-)
MEISTRWRRASSLGARHRRQTTATSPGTRPPSRRATTPTTGARLHWRTQIASEAGVRRTPRKARSTCSTSARRERSWTWRPRVGACEWRVWTQAPGTVSKLAAPSCLSGVCRWAKTTRRMMPWTGWRSFSRKGSKTRPGCVSWSRRSACSVGASCRATWTPWPPSSASSRSTAPRGCWPTGRPARWRPSGGDRRRARGGARAPLSET